jgi:thiamine-phosphate pyrophosphorylase
VELVRELRADGVHLGKNDMPIAAARQLLGPGFIIGGTANTFADVKAISEAGGDYVGCGPFRFTTTKEKLSPILGLDGYRHIVSRMLAEGICIPIVAIGGIEADDIQPILAT